MIRNKLPKEIVNKISAKRLRTIIILPIIIILLVNILVFAYLQAYNPNRGYALIIEKWKILFRQSEKIDWLIIGDSAGNQGVNPDIFQKKLKQKAVNLCTIGDLMTLDDSWMLDYFIKKNGPPKNILIVHVYDIWFRNINQNVLAQVPNLILKEKLRPQLNLTFRQKLKYYKKKYMPLYYQDKSIGEVVKKPVTYLFKRNDNIQDNGFEPMEDPLPDSVLSDTRRHLEFVKNEKYKLSDYNLQGLKSIKKLAKQYKINVYIANSPIHSELYESQEFMEYFRNIQQMLEKYCKERGFHYINNPPITFSENELQNSDHVILSAANEYTNIIIDEIIEIENSKSFK